jgi:transposase-like protein
MENTKIDEGTSTSLHQFRDGPTTEQRAAAITALLTRRTLASVVKTPEFQQGLASLVDQVRSNDAASRLAAVAQLGRIEQSAKSIATNVRNLTAAALDVALAPSILLKDAEDRFYVAKACSWVQAPWVLPYAIDAIANEVPNADKVRAELFHVVFRDASSLSEIFGRLSDALSKIRTGTDSPGNSIARRLIRILGALRNEVATSLLPTGEDIGKRFAEMVSVPLSGAGLPSDDQTRIAVAREIVLCTYDIVRTRLSVFADADMYGSIRFARRLFGASNWPEELADALGRISDVILEAILLLGKQGIASRPLVAYLELVAGHPREAERRLARVAEAHPELPEAIRAWLRRESARGPSSDSLAESDLLRTDPEIGEALLESRRLEDLLSEVTVNVIPALELYDPSKVEIVSRLLSQARRQIDAVKEVGRRRNLLVHGRAGDRMPFSPKYFESASDTVEKEVRIVRPAVVRATADGNPGEVVVKGLVE